MTYFGETIRKAREAKGLTTSQIAEKTHILVQIINAMEHEDFKQIKAAIYGRGFVKLICECLEIDPKPLVAEFMDIYEGRRPPVSSDAFLPKAPPAPSPAEPARRPEPEFAPSPAADAPVLPDLNCTADTGITEPPPAEPALTEIAEASMPDSAELAMPGITEAINVDVPPPPPNGVYGSAQENMFPGNSDNARKKQAQEQTKGLDLFDPPPATTETPSQTRVQDIFASTYADTEEQVVSGPSAAEKFRRGLSVVSHGVLGSVRSIPRSAWRMAVLVLGALIVLVLLIWGCSILYRVTESPAAVAADVQVTAGSGESAETSVQPAEQPAKQTAGKKPSAIGSKPGQDAKPAKPKLRSTGQKVPPLYVD